MTATKHGTVFAQCCSAQTGRLVLAHTVHAVELRDADYMIDGHYRKSVQFYHNPGKCPMIGRAILEQENRDD